MRGAVVAGQRTVNVALECQGGISCVLVESAAPSSGRRRPTARALVYRRYGLRGSHRFPEWEVDRRVPLELGGSNAITNLWPEHHPQAKDRLENRFHDRVCTHQITLARAQAIFKSDWRPHE
jgi:hypothetical protein